ncbi:MAG: pilus assembly protein [Pseudomonadota bacterium]
MSVLSKLKRFRRGQEGALTVEAMLVLPMLLWGIGAIFIYWDAFKTHNINIKAGYTVADLISRESVPLDADYIDGMNNIYEFLIKSGRDNNLRVSVVAFTQEDEDAPILKNLSWSYATGDLVEHADISELDDELPTLNPGDQLIVVETEMTWTPPIGMDIFVPTLEQMEFRSQVFTTPRFVPQVVFETS